LKANMRLPISDQ